MSRRTSAWVAVVGVVASCTHAGAPSGLPEVLWPPPPDAPRARLTAIWPEPPRPGVRKPAWRRALEAIAGAEPSADEPRRALERPFDVAVAPSGEILIADPDVPAVLELSLDGRSRSVVCPGEPWIAPMAVRITSGGTIYVADAGRAAIVRIVAGGRCEVFGRGALERPTGIGVREGRIFVADPPRHSIVVLASNGEVLDRLGGSGDEEGRLSFPTAVDVAPNGEILVVDALNFRVARFSPEGTWLGSFGAPGDSGGSFVRPKGIAVGEDGRIYVSDAQRDTVLAFRADGAFDFALGEGGAAAGRFAHPAGLAVTGSTLLVADSHNRRIQVFQLLDGDGS